MTMADDELSTAFHELLDELGGALERKFLTSDPPPLSEADILDGYRLTFSLLRVAVDTYVWGGDKDNPRFVDVIGPYQRWGRRQLGRVLSAGPPDRRRPYLPGHRQSR